MKPLYEKILPLPGTSWRYWLYEADSIPFCWHYHPEYELCLTLNSQGKRYIGDSIDDYDDLDLVLLGPRLPHTWCSRDAIVGDKHYTYVAQIPTQWIDHFIDFPEFSGIRALFNNADNGLVFSKTSAIKIKTYFELMHTSTELDKLIYLMKILGVLVDDKFVKTISHINLFSEDQNDPAVTRIDRVIEHIYKNFNREIFADDMAKIASMSTNHFHRFFKKRTEKTLTQYITDLRIGKACTLLSTSDRTISSISYDCGFNNLSNFNRHFLSCKGCTPREYRAKFPGKVGGVFDSSSQDA